MKFFWFAFACLVLLVAGCSLTFYQSSADRQVEKILQEKQGEVKKSSGQIPGLSFQTQPETCFLKLKDALILAAKNNRDYQSRKENVYLKALELTGKKFQYSWQAEEKVSVGWQKDSGQQWAASSNFQLFKWLADGAQITLDMTKDFLQFFTGDKSKSFQSILQLNLLQPLLRGCGRRIVQEDLTQAEREVVYEMRSFLRYQRSFSVQVARQYFQLLLARDTLENNWANYLFLRQARERIEMLAESGRLPPLQADQARQNELQAYQSWLKAVNDYQSGLDSFRTFLSLPLNQPVVLDKEILNNLLAKGTPEPGREKTEFLQAALSGRLDLLTAADRVEDARRKVQVARDNLRNYLSLKVNLSSNTDESEHPTFSFLQPAYGAGFEFSFPFSRVQERNVYVESLINLERKQRDLFLTRDNIATEVAESYRRLQEAYQTYLIQKSSLALAERRVESTDLLLQAGRATTRDLLEAQDAFIRARNALSAAVVNYQITYLDLLCEAEMLEVDDTGVWKGDLYEKTTR